MSAPVLFPTLILASASPRRRDLLAQIGVCPGKIVPADIDETERPDETARVYVGRVAREKATHIAATHGGSVILAADTAVACGRRILPKTEDAQAAYECLALLSGRSHRVYTGVVLVDADGRSRQRVVETRVKVRQLSAQMITRYVASGEWNGKAGGYGIQGAFAEHVISIIGSYTNIVGLPLYETSNLLNSVGFAPKAP